jgi:cation:H+ antiporter
VYQFDSVGLTLGWVGADSLFLFILYFVCMRVLYKLERAEEQTEDTNRDMRVLRKSIVGFVVCALIVTGSGLAMPVIGKIIVTQMGWNDAFFGSVFLAFATSLPELVVTISALSIGAVDIALGNVLGSNLFNIATIFVNDLVMPKALFFQSISTMHLVTGLSAVVMSSLALLGFMIAPRSKYRIGWPSSLIFGLYVICMYILYQA